MDDNFDLSQLPDSFFVSFDEMYFGLLWDKSGRCYAVLHRETSQPKKRSAVFFYDLAGALFQVSHMEDKLFGGPIIHLRDVDGRRVQTRAKRYLSSAVGRIERITGVLMEFGRSIPSSSPELAWQPLDKGFWEPPSPQDVSGWRRQAMANP